MLIGWGWIDLGLVQLIGWIWRDLRLVTVESGYADGEAEADEKIGFHLGIMLLVLFHFSIYEFADLLHYGILMLAQKSVSQYGDGEGALACWKNSMADYHDEKKVSFKHIKKIF